DIVHRQLWDVKSGKVRVVFANVAPRGASAAFSPDNSTLALLSATADAVVLWDVRSGEQRSTHSLYRSGAVALAFTPDGKRLAGIFSDGAMQVWPRKLLEQTRAVGKTGAAVFSLALDLKGKEATLVTENSVDCWDLVAKSKRASLPLPKGTRHCTACPGEAWLVAVIDEDGALKVLGSGPGKEIPIARVETRCRPAFTQDRNQLAAATVG